MTKEIKRYLPEYTYDDIIQSIKDTKYSDVLDLMIEAEGNGYEWGFEIFDFTEWPKNKEEINAFFSNEIGNPFDISFLDNEEIVMACVYCATKVPISKVALTINTRWEGYEGYHAEGFCTKCIDDNPTLLEDEGY